jgi:hypothetical protein
MFDPAACLGVELDPAHQLLRPDEPLDTYIARCPSGFGDGARERPLLRMEEVVRVIAGWPEWKAGIRGWLAAFADAMDTFLEVVRHVPPEWLPPERAAFACRLLRTRLEWLSGRSSA